MEATWVVLGLLACWAWWALRRNDAVYHKMIELTDRIYKANCADIAAGKQPEEYDWRWHKIREIDQASYVFSLWKPVDNLYNDTDFGLR